MIKGFKKRIASICLCLIFQYLNNIKETLEYKW